jgi:glycosyltransferase involved in cell wall biosynthesis
LAYAAADICVVPSYYEPFGLVALESQRMGTPVVVSDTGGLSETLRQTGGGLAFSPGDAKALSECFQRLLSDEGLRVELGRRGQTGVARHYDWPELSRRIVDVYQEAWESGPPRNIVPPAWSAAEAKPKAQVAACREGDESDSAPVSDIVVFWDTAFMGDLGPILARLADAHALKILNGRIFVFPVVFHDKKGLPWVRPFEHPRVRFTNLSEAREVQGALSNVAVAIVHPFLAEPLVNWLHLNPNQVPVVWVGAKEGFPFPGMQVHELDEIHAAVGKLLCDDRLRRRVAPDLACEIPSAHWHVPPREKPLVVHVLPQLVTGGAETTLLELVKGAKEKMGHAVLSLGPMDGPLPAEFSELGIPVWDAKGWSPERIIDHLVRQAPDILHLHSLSYVPSWLPIHRRFRDVQIIETEHVVNIGAGHFGPVRTVVCVSEATRKAHAAHCDLLSLSGTTLGVIYNGIEESDYRSLPSRAEARQRLGLPEARPIIGRVSALARGKLPMEALEAIPRILKTAPEALFAIVGDGPEREPAARWVAERGLTESVIFLGERRDIPTVLRAIDVFAYYTNRDALGNVILEAVAAGIPVVATDVEGTKEALGSAPGELVPLGDLDHFAERVVYWLKKTRGSPLPKKARLPHRFTRQAMVKGYTDLYRRLSREGQKSEPAKARAGWPEFPPVNVLMPIHNPRLSCIPRAGKDHTDS